MKILHVVNSLEHGGLEKLTLRLVKSLKEGGVNCEIVCLSKAGELAEIAEASGIKVTTIGRKNKFDFGLIFKLMKICKKSKADIIHTHNFGPLIYGTLAAKLCGKKCINTRHGRTNDKTYRFIWAMNDFVIPVSKDTQKHLTEFNRIAKSKMRVIYNGVNLNRYSSSMNDEQKRKIKKGIGLPKDAFLILNVGRLSREKDQETLLKAFRKLRKKKADVYLAIVGDGVLREKLESIAKDFEIAERVCFLGFRNDVNDLVGACDVYVSSSYREGLSLAILEAMACGKPVIATKIGGTAEAVLDGKTGYLVPCGFPERIETAIMKIFINRKILAELGVNARKRAEELFSLKTMVQCYQDLYHEVLNRS